jgi:hypothetical protein
MSFILHHKNVWIKNFKFLSFAENECEVWEKFILSFIIIIIIYYYYLGQCWMIDSLIFMGEG